ncbi:MAG: hypothetical protein ACOVO1_01095 [Chitinophagaceae bacterium]
MKLKLTLVLMVLFVYSSFSQTTTNDFKVGHIFTVSLPSYMTKTTGINSAASLQYKNTVKDVYGFIIEDSKEELKILEINYTSAKEFYDDFIKDFLPKEKNRKVSEPIMKKIGDNSFVDVDFSYYDKDAKAEIYYSIGIVETPTTFYKILTWATAANKDKFKADFQKIIYSIKD